MGNEIYLFSAYSITWIIIFLFIYTISRRQRRLENQIAEMKKEILKE